MFYSANAMAISTHKTRRVQCRSYFEFCETFNLTSLPADAHQICRYLVYLARTLKYSSINNYLSGVIMLHKLFGYPHDFRSDFRVLFTLQGLKRVLGDTSLQKSPLMPEDLRRMVLLVNQQKPVEKAVWACVVLAFRTLLRKSNLLPSESESHCLRRRDITFTSWGMRVTVGSSKTIQFKERCLEIPVVSIPTSPLCAVRLVKDHFDMTKSALDSDYVFMIPCGTGLKPLEYGTALNKLKSWGSVVAPSKDLGFHSLRRGAATHMSILGIRLEDIKAAGDWASLAVLVYLTTPFSHKIAVDNVVANSLR